MEIADVQTICQPLSAGMLMGDQGSTRTIQAINDMYGVNAGTVYSEAGSQHYLMVQQSIDNIVSKLITANDLLRTVSDFKQILDREQLCYVPEPMQLPILTMPEIRELHQQGKLYGFGVPADAVPDEDVYGRMINSGRVSIVGYDDNPEEIYRTFEWNSSDPELSLAELENIRATREFISEMLQTQREAGGDQLDPTDYPNKFIEVKIK